MENLSNIGVIRDLLARHGFRFSKALGQNFLVNPTVCPRMAEQGGAGPGVGVIEIGAGVGVLTAELARRADRVVCVEIDGRLLPVLAETLAGFQNVEIVNADVMKVDLRALIAEKLGGLRVVVCANLPYYITSPIVMGLLEQRLPIESVTVMVQKEAAQRLCALPGTREAGAVSCAVRYYSEPKVLFPVSRGSFLPSPDVDSAVIRLDIRREPPVDPGTKKPSSGWCAPPFRCGARRCSTAFRRPAASQGARRGPARAGGGARGGARRAAHAGTVRRRQPRAGGGGVIKNGAPEAPRF